MAYFHLETSEMSVAQRLSKLPPEQQDKALSKLSAEQMRNLPYDWNFWGRRKQLIPVKEFLMRPLDLILRSLDNLC